MLLVRLRDEVDIKVKGECFIIYLTQGLVLHFLFMNTVREHNSNFHGNSHYRNETRTDRQIYTDLNFEGQPYLSSRHSFGYHLLEVPAYLVLHKARTIVACNRDTHTPFV
jgi:hypothetical protein